MSYMWENFNIKPFPAETIVYRDGVYCPELSTIKNGPIDKNYDLPVHIIYVGEISGKCRLDIDVNIPNQHVYLSVNIKNKLPAFFNIFIKNTGKNSEIRGHILIDNYDNLVFDCIAHHGAQTTSILLQNKLIANRDSISKLSATAIIDKNCENCNSDINFSAISDKNAKIEFLPAQRISSIPENAGHSASIFSPKPIQIQFLREAGLSSNEIPNVMRESFINDFSLF
ncbi:MAG: SufD family Fe-S cluster assembly protein [Alphaproteobacteria bacterium]|nr:SufD family Fe-S cluster assembly protein [Alphaproteobacteria bacterium]